MASCSSSRAPKRATSTSSQCSPESTSANNGILKIFLSKSDVKKYGLLTSKFHRLVGQYPGAWLRGVNAESWVLDTLESLYNLVFNATCNMHDPAQRKQKFDEIKHHLTGRARTGAGPTVGIPSLRPEHVKRAHYYFPPAHKGHANKSTVEESGNSGAESSAPSSQGLRPNPTTRKRPAAEPLLQASSKQPRHQQMAASDITGDSTQCHPTKHSLSSEFDQYHDRVAGSYQKMIHTLHTLASITKDRLVGEQVDLDRLKSQMRDVTVVTESVTKLKDSISTIEADMAAHAAS
ncbi:hypothetical protein ACKLNR_013620 [Fusarium oxysporum f. sp. zingiberi]